MVTNMYLHAFHFACFHKQRYVCFLACITEFSQGSTPVGMPKAKLHKGFYILFRYHCTITNYRNNQ